MSFVIQYLINLVAIILPTSFTPKKTLMRKIYLLLVAVLFTVISNAQISVTVTGNTNTTPNLQASYASLAAAITDLNTVTALSGPVTFNLAAGTTESVSSQLNITLAGDLANAITFQKSGAGANPSVSRTDAGSNTTSTIGGLGDAVIRIDGTDNIHFNGLDVSASNQGIEYGYFTSKTATNACQTLSIKNATITMTKGTSAYVIGIYIGNGTSSVSSATGVTVSANSGRTENVTISGNTIQNVHAGVYCRGSSAAGFYDQNITVGQSGEGNTIRNFGGGAAATTYGAYFIYTNNASVGYNTIDNSGGGGTAHASTFYGIFYSTVTGVINGSNNAFTINTTGTSGVQAIYNSNAVTSNTFNNNTFTGNITTTSTTYLIYASSTTPAVNVIGNSISGSLTKGGASGSFYCYYNLGSPTSGVETITNNNFSNITSAGTGSLYGIYTNTATGQNRVCHSNTISNWTTGSTGSVYGIYCLSTTANEIYNNNVNNINCSASGSLYGIYFSGTNPSVYNNTIHTLTSTSATTFYGMQSAGTGTVNIYKNKIYGLINNNSASTATNLLSGLAVTTNGTTTNIYNNLIGSLTAPASVSTEAIRGISLSATTSSTTINLSYNTVYLAASSTGANFGTTGVYASGNATASTANLVMRNNLVYNGSAAAGTGLTVAYRRSSTSLTNYNSTSNNNLFFAGTPSASNLVFNDGTNSDQTLATYKARVSPADAASITENASFVSTTGSSANYLHINPAVPTQIESGATPVAGITDDFDGDARNATTPDVGADEGTFMLLDLTPPSISYTALGFTCATTDRTLTATITDPSGVPTSGAGLPVLYWKINSGSYSAVTGVSTGSNQYQFTFGSGVVQSDIVSYYVVAQDNAGTPNVGAFPSAGAGSFTANPPAAGTAPTTPSSYSISANMSGTYNIGTVGDFATLTAAVSAYNASCLTGPVVFNLTDASYSASETFPIVINANSYASATNTLTIKPATGVAVSISGSNSSTLLKLNGADYVTIDGLNSGGSSLTIQNTNSANSAVVIWIGSNAADGATNNAIKNCTVSGNTGTTTIGCILAGDGGTLGNAATAANSNNTIQGNTLKAAQNGIYVSGLASTFDQNWLITQNTIGSTSVANDKMSYRGIAVLGCGNFVVSNNTINGVVSTTSSSSTMTGISVYNAIADGIISGNKISDIKQVNTTGWGSNGIGLFATTTASNLTVANNFVSDVASYGYNGATASDNGYGIMVGTGGGYNIYFNTVNMTTNQTSTTGLPAAINISSSITTVNSINLRNNILSNVQTVGTNRYAIYSGAAANVFADINYNDYYSAAGTLGYLGSAQNTLANWQTATGKDTKSISYQPAFTSATDLHLANTAGANWCLNGAGTSIAGITADIDNDTRATTPDIGADEFAATGFVVNNPAAVCTPSTVDLTAAAVTTGSTSGLTFTYWTDATATTSLSTPNAVAASGTYYIKASDGTCSMILPVTVTVNTSPALFTVTGGGNYCSGGSGVAVGLSGSETGIDYQLYNGASAVGSPVAGTGAAIGFGTQTTAGTYTVVATNTTSSCTTTMTGSATVTVDPLPAQFSVTGGGSFCAGGTGVAIGLSGSESGVNYQLYNGASAVGSPVAGTGAAISFGNQTGTGTYTVEAVNTTTTCSSSMTGSATVSTNPVQTIGSVVTQPTTCFSTDGAINITVGGSSGPYTYSWSTGDGSGLVAGQEDQSGLTVGQYTVVVTDQTTGCTQTETFSLSGPGGCSICPTVGALTTNPATVACQNTPVTLTASGLVAMSNIYGIDFKVSATPLADPYTGGSIIATVANASLTGGGTTATAIVTPPDAGSFYLYAVLTPTPLDPACRPYAGITVTVNPTPTVDAVSNQVVCNNGSTTAVAFTGAVPGTVYNWTNTLSSIGLAASGTGDIASFTATNTTNAPVTATVTVTPTTSAASAVPEVLYYRFDGTGTSVPNLASAPPAGTATATIMGGLSQGGSAICNGTLIGSGAPSSTDYLNTGWAPDLGTSSWTISFKSENIGPSATLYYIFGDANTSSLRCFTNGVAGADNWILRGPVTDVLLTGGATVAAHTNTFVYDATAGNIKAYLDGVLVNTVAQSPITISGTGPFKVMGYSTNVGAPLDGHLDEFRVYNRALSAAEVLALNPCSSTTTCSGTPTTFTYTVNPTPTVDAVSDKVECAGSATAAINFTGSVSGTVYNWTNNNTSIGLAASGSGNIASFTPVNAGATAVTATITVTPSYTNAGTTCTGTPISFTITVGPTPTVDAVSNQVVCNNGTTTAVNFTGSLPGTTYSWTNTLASIGLAASGTGNIPSFTATNATNAPVTATVTVTPSLATGGTISQTFNYTGAVQTFTVPAGVTSITIDAFGAEGGTGAAGNSVSGATLGGAGGKGSKASGTLTVTPGQVLNIYVGGGGTIPTGGYNGGGAGGNANSGGGGGASDVRFPGTTAGDRILVAAGGGGGGRGGCESTNVINGGAGGDGDNNGANGTDAPTSGGVAGAGGGGTLVAGGAAGVGCGGFLGQPGVAGLADGTGGAGGAGQSCCCFSFGSVPGGGGGGGGYLGGGGGGGGSAGTAACSGNDKGAGGGGAGGSSYTGGVSTGAVTTGVQSGNGMIVISYTAATTTCAGTPTTFTYTVNPTPNAVATPASQANCSGNAITTIALSGNVSGTTYSWTRDNTASVTGIAASGSGNISGTLTNTTTAPITVTFTITPTANGCTGTPITATVVVNPIPNAVAAPATQTVCTGTAITTIVLTGNVSGTTYNWTRNNTTNVTGIAASGSGNISGTLTNTTTTQQTVTFTITPTANGCSGTPITATVIVNPTPTITCPANIVRNADPGICGAVVTYPPATATGTPTPTITYSIASGSTFPVGVTTVTATATNACGTATCTFTVTVVDNQAPTITCPANIVRNTDAGSCTATFAPANPTTADNCTVTLLTWTMSGATTGSSPATGINNLGSRTFNMGVTTVAYTVKDAAGNTSNCSFTVTINDGQLPVVSAQPVNRTVCAGTNATFSVTATNVVTYQWQQWNGTAWVNIAGANSSSYTVSSTTTAMNTNTFRVILNGLCTVVNSNAATLFVNPLPAITLDAATTASIWPNQTSTITATATPAGGTFVWTWNGSPVSGVSGAVLGPISIDRIGDYKVTYTDLNGCVNTSAVISITPAPSDNNLWVYPNPTTAQFNVRYYNQNGEKSTLRIYNAAGQVVFEQALSLGIAYSNTPVNLYHVAAGIYVVKVVDSEGRALAARSIVIYH